MSWQGTGGPLRSASASAIYCDIAYPAVLTKEEVTLWVKETLIHCRLLGTKVKIASGLLGQADPFATDVLA